MDTSETYVKMCDKAVEIQVLAKLLEKDQYSFWVCSKWHLPVHSGRFFSDDIWLPRQDQLQEMVDWERVYPLVINHGVDQFYLQDKHGTIILGYSMEQLWLAFVISELHHKTWNGEEWVTQASL